MGFKSVDGTLIKTDLAVCQVSVIDKQEIGNFFAYKIRNHGVGSDDVEFRTLADN